MPLTTNVLSAETPYVHALSQKFMGHRTTYFVKPHEWVGELLYDCVGLFAFSEDKSIIFAVFSDGHIQEITPNYFPQAMCIAFEGRFRHLASELTVNT